MKEIFERRSVRQFQDKPVDKAVLEKLVEAGMEAPTACDDRQWHFYIVTSPEMKEKLAASAPYATPAAKAAADIVVAYEKDAGNVPEYAHINMALISENIMLEAVSQGLGSVMFGVAPHKERMEALHEILHLPADQEAFAILAVGYPAKVPPYKDKTNPERVHWVE